MSSIVHGAVRTLILALALPLAAEPCDTGVAGLENLLDEVLPVRTQPVWKTGARKIVSVRYTPADAAAGEVLLTMTEREDGSVAARLRRIPQGLTAQVDAVVAEAPDARCSDLVSRVTIRDTELSGDELQRVRRLYQSLRSTTIPVDVPSEIYLDSAKYELYVSGGMTELALTLFAATAEGEKPHPLVGILTEMIHAPAPERREVRQKAR